MVWITENSMMIGSLSVIAVLILLVGTLMVRLSKDQNHRHGLESKLTFFDALLKSDPRFTLWVYGSGAVQADPMLKNMLGMEKTPHHLSDLEGYMSAEALDALTHDQTQKAQKKSNKTHAMSFQMGDRDIYLEITAIANCPPHMPEKLVWISAKSEKSATANPKESWDEIKEGPEGAKHDDPQQLLRDKKSLKQRLKFAYQTIDALPSAVWVWTVGGQITHVNQTYVNAVEGSTVQRTLDHQQALFDPKDKEKSQQLFDNLRQNNTKVRERLFAVVGGNRRLFKVTHQLSPDGLNILSVAQDITSEEDALSELSRVLESQSVTLNRLASPVAIFGPDKALKFYNQAFRLITGLSEERLEVLSSHEEILDEMRVLRRLPEQADFKAWKENILGQYTGLMEPVEDIWHIPDGSTYRVVTQPHPLGGILLLMEDMTDTLALQRSVSTLTAVQSQTLENLHEAVAVFGADGNLRLCNQGFIDLWQLQDLATETHQLTGHHMVAITAVARAAFQSGDSALKPDQADNRKNNDQSNRQLIEQLSGWVSRRDQQTGLWQSTDNRVIDFALMPLPDGSSLLTQIDITDSFTIQKALRERSQALEMADRMKTEFIANMAYELRTPLNSIMGFTDLLLAGLYDALSQKQDDTLHNIKSASQDLNHLINNVLDIAVINSGEADLTITPVDLAACFSSIREMSADMVRRKNSRLSYQADSNLPMIMGDESRLKQGIYSLLSALTGLGAWGSAIDISLSAGDKETVNITAEVSNITLKENDFSALAEAVTSGRSVAMQGASTMDLLLVRSIIDVHHGQLSLQQASENSLRVEIDLPVTYAALDKPRPIA